MYIMETLHATAFLMREEAVFFFYLTNPAVKNFK